MGKAQAHAGGKELDMFFQDRSNRDWPTMIVPHTVHQSEFDLFFVWQKAVCSQGSSATPRPHLATQAASSLLRSPEGEIELISNDAMHRVSEIKLIRTDTTLDLSQKAEKV